MKNLQHKGCIFCAETVKICAAASEHIFLAAASERKCAVDIFYVEANVWLLLETLHQ